MPALGESVTEGTVTRWLKNVGDEVASTSRCSRSRPTRSTPRSRRRCAGTVTADPRRGGRDRPRRWRRSPSSVGAPPGVRAPLRSPARPEPEPSAAGSRAPPGRGGAQGAPEAPAAARTGDASRGPRRPAAADRTAAPSTAPGHAAPAPDDQPDASAYVTPLVRKLAADHDVDLAAVTGTGVGGRIRKQDVLAAPRPRRRRPSPPRAGRPAAPRPPPLGRGARACSRPRPRAGRASAGRPRR